MSKIKPSTIAEYIEQAPEAGKAKLRQLYALLKSVAPDAVETIKWGAPFFIEPRFLFSFSAHKAHLSFAPTSEALALFSGPLAHYQTTKHYLKISYSTELPESLIRQIAEHRVEAVRARADDGFW